jgi:hypothetical protein
LARLAQVSHCALSFLINDLPKFKRRDAAESETD